tara:strand:+ start:273 stop:788 length:516 start_codon:yes stop_codon:yes gene_type:complete
VSSDQQLEEFLLDHLASLRALKCVGDADIVTCIEQNYGGWVGASRVAAICSASRPVRHLSGDSTGKNRVGVVTSSDTKEGMRFALQQFLRSERVHFAKRFVSKTVGAREELCSQLKAYRFVDKGREDDLLVRRRGLSGKHGGKLDDLCIALQLLAYWPNFYFDKPQRARIV